MNKILNLKIALIILLFINPLAVLLLSKSYVYMLIILVFSAWIIFLCFRSQKEWLRIVVLNIAALVSVLLYTETIFRYLYQDKNIPVIYELRNHYCFNKPYLRNLFCTNEYATIYCTNCKGYRIDNIANPDIPTQNGTILFLGDSFTQGAQVQYSEMFSSLTQKHYPNKKVINAGISGAGIVDEYYYYIDEGQKLKCKTVFLEIGVFNDFFNIKERSAGLEEICFEKMHLYTYLKYQMNEMVSKKIIHRWTEPFFQDKQENIDNNILYKKTSEVKERDKRNFITTLKALNNTIKRNHGNLVVILIPSKEQVSTKLLNEVLSKYHISPSELDITYPNRWMGKQTKDLGIDFIDLLNEFKKSKKFPYFFIDEHMNADGHRIVSDAIINYLK